MLVLTSSVAALACGGFFCDSPPPDPYSPTVTLPVAQSGEQIVFGVADGTVTAHVLISYEGEADAFAWVLPVPGEPDVFLSSRRLFQVLDAATKPQVTLSEREVGCWSASVDAADADADADADSDSDTDADADLDTPPSVTVLAQETVGPYDSVVLAADDAEALVDWLQANAYDVPDSFAGAILPYVAPGMTFLALKLAKDNDAGDIEPIGLRWPGDLASIPLSLTALAATEDMPISVYLVGEGRGVPLSSLHVDLNPLGWDWFGTGLDLPFRLGQAVDEAGGNAFMTAYAGASVARVGVPSTDGLATIADALDWFRSLPSDITDDPAILPVLDEFLPAPDGVGLPFYNRPEDYPDEWTRLDDGFDPAAATAAIEERIVEPRRDADELLAAGSWLTRLDTVLSPDEMVVDPLFGFNPDLPEVEPARRATLTTTCGSSEDERSGDRTLALPDGHLVPVPPLDELPAGVSTSQWLEQHILHDAILVTQFSESGPGEVIADHRAELDFRLPSGEPPASPSAAGGGCGCRDVSGGTAPLAALALLLRRRRATLGG